jgi:peptide/nickel transport system permease protein
MTSITAPPISAGPRQSSEYWLSAVASKTVGRTGARIGLVWVGVIVVCAVFAPLLANTHPLLMKSDGRWTSPALRHMNWADVTLLTGFFIGIVLLIFGRRFTATARITTFLVIVIAAMALSLWKVRPPTVVVWDQYRRAESAGKVEFVLRAPIPYSPEDRLRDQFDVARPHPRPPEWPHVLGTERQGSNVLSRMIHAARIALAVGLIAEGIAVTLGVIIGGLMGYFAGWVDLLGMRLVEIFSSIPSMYLLLTFVAFFGRNLYMIMVIIGITGWTGFAAFTRAEFLKLRNQDFVQSAIAAGVPTRRVLFRHILPNGITPVLVSLSFGIASAILAESTLSFLGLGPVDAPSWGALLNQAVSAGGGFYWWLATFPGLAIFLTVFAYNMIGEAVRDALDPRFQGKGI